MTDTEIDPFDRMFGPKPVITSIDAIDDLHVASLRMHFLRLSPSYNLAIKLIAEKAKLEDLEVVEQVVRLYEAPAHQMRKRGHYKGAQEHFSSTQRAVVMEIFQKVMETARKFGDLNDEYVGLVNSNPFAYWTTPYSNYPHVGLIGVWNERGEEHSKFLSDLKKFTDWAQDEHAFEPALVLLIPLRAYEKDVAAEVKEFLNEFRDPSVNRKQVEKVPLYGKRIRPEAILKKLKVLLGRFLYPELTLWELAIKVNVSDVYTGMYKNSQNSLDKEQRERLNVITSRLLHQAMNLAESAAVGLFPQAQKYLIPNYDPEKTCERILKIWPDIR